ncbi:ZIP zinc transporter-domain-containing protein [Hypomontagnella monticulosa]|nr:ZIP zinc transporter-domain-containing protein [Hypomontagnella monticulosa]
MICVSRPDKNSFRHLTFNQSPSPFAAGHTTRQDFNGLCNLRAHVEGGQDDGSGSGGSSHSGQSGLGCDEVKCQSFCVQPEPLGACNGTEGPSQVLGQPPCREKVGRGEKYHSHPNVQLSSPSSCYSHVWGWIRWAFSVLAAASLLSWWREPAFSARISEPANTVKATNLSKRSSSSTCPTGGANEAEYNTPLHVGGLLIILFVSSLACAFPILARRFPGLRIPGRFFFAVRHVGTGVLIATAFVHLLPTAFISLGDPCLSDFWTSDYPAMPGAIALAAVFLVIVIEMVFHPSRHVPPAPITSSGCVAQQASDETTGHVSPGCMGSAHMMVPIGDMGPLRGRTTSIGQGLTRLDTEGREAEQRFEQGHDGQDQPKHSLEEEPVVEILSFDRLTPEQRQRKELLQCVLLELGILFHSVFIGMALSVSIGNEFVILLIAIVFHQSFEGLALGSRISAIKWPKGSKQPWLMALAYGCTTPIGQAIGLATHTLYSPDSEVGLLLVGIMNAISAGLLTFASLVELLSEDFLSDESWRFLRGRRRVYACLLVFLGAFFMSLVGAWA